MTWSGKHPNKHQLRHLCEIMFKYFGVSRMGGGCVKSSNQLFYRVLNIINKTEDRELIQSEYDFWASRAKNYEIDDAVQSVFDFKRNLIGYNLPKIILAISDIQRTIFKRYNYFCGDYTAFAFSLESMYLPAPIVALEEFGIPAYLANKIYDLADANEDSTVDSLLGYIIQHKKIIPGYFDGFERKLLERAIAYI
jgi:hypothetical protein